MNVLSLYCLLGFSSLPVLLAFSLASPPSPSLSLFTVRTLGAFIVGLRNSTLLPLKFLDLLVCFIPSSHLFPSISHVSELIFLLSFCLEISRYVFNSIVLSIFRHSNSGKFVHIISSPLLSKLSLKKRSGKLFSTSVVVVQLSKSFSRSLSCFFFFYFVAFWWWLRLFARSTSPLCFDFQFQSRFMYMSSPYSIVQSNFFL